MGYILTNFTKAKTTFLKKNKRQRSILKNINILKSGDFKVSLASENRKLMETFVRKKTLQSYFEESGLIIVAQTPKSSFSCKICFSDDITEKRWK